MVYQQGISVRASKAQHSMVQDCTTSKADPLLYQAAHVAATVSAVEPIVV
jgi:hypothetical protein